MKFIKRLKGSIWLHLVGSALIMALLISASTYLIKQSIDKHEQESGQTILESLGKELGKAKREFDKGYDNDTIK